MIISNISNLFKEVKEAGLVDQNPDSTTEDCDSKQLNSCYADFCFGRIV